MNAKLLLLVPLVLLATGCEEEGSDLNAWMQETQQRAKANLKPPVAPEKVEPAHYTTPAPITPHAFSLYRMKAMVDTSASMINAPNLNRPKELLENASLDKLKFVGTIGSGNNLSALISLDNQTVYTVKLGNYMGQDYGRVVKITPDEITLRETVEDAEGNWVPRQTVLALGVTPEIQKK